MTPPTAPSRFDRRLLAAQLAFGLFAAVSLIGQVGDALRDRDAYSILMTAAWAIVVGSYFAILLVGRARATSSDTGGDQ